MVPSAGTEQKCRGFSLQTHTSCNRIGQADWNIAHARKSENDLSTGKSDNFIFSCNSVLFSQQGTQ